MTELGCVQVGVHGACMKAHRGNREVLIDDTSLWMRIEHLVDGSIDLLTHVPTEPLPRRAARRRKLCLRHPLLLKAGAQFSFVSALVPIVAMFASQCAMERPVALTRRGRDEVGDANIYSHHRSSRCRLQRSRLNASSLFILVGGLAIGSIVTIRSVDVCGLLDRDSMQTDGKFGLESRFAV